MNTRKFRRSFWFMLASEITVAAHLLLFLPPKAQAAVPNPAESKEESGESALAMIAIERSEPAPQETVVVNKTVPNVEPPPQYPSFSPVPTDEELFKARVFGEPLIPEAGESNDAENQALAQAITTYLHGGNSEALEPLEGVVTNFPNSRWRVAVQASVGSWYRQKGYFTRAQRNLTEAWRLGKNSKTEGVRRLAEFAAGELMQIHMQFGQVDPLEALVTEFEGRELSGGITEKLYAAKATVWGLRNDHAKAIPSGSVALERLRLDKHEKAERQKKDQDPSYRKKAFVRHQELDRFPAKHEGATLAEIQDLADLTDLKLQMVRRENPNAEIAIPSIVHLKQGHFAALVEQRGERFRFDDPLLGGEVWITRQAFEEEISGFFLVEQGRLPQGWRNANRPETGSIRGKCVYAVPGDDGTTQNNVCKPCPGGGAGMARYAFHLLLASLNLRDNPVGYSPPRGPEVRFEATYNQREANQPATFYYSNLGKRWTHNWLSYVQDDPTAVGNPVDVYVRGGGREPYSGFVSGVSAPQQDIRAILTIASTSPIKYERELPDGSKEVFAQSDGAATAPRRVFLTEWKDPQGNKLTFTYDGQLRLVSVTDAIGQVTTLSYELAADPLKITKVTDPFSRSATFAYDEFGQLVRITDVIGLQSELEYGSSDFIRALTTPYGTTTFRHGTHLYSVPANRWVQATDPLGGTERVEFLLTNGQVPATDAANTVPTGFTGNSNLDTHMSVYYSKLAMSRATTDPPSPTNGEITRWRSSTQFKISGYQIQSTKLPLENRVWYEHQGETLSNGVGSDGRPAKIGRVLDDGSPQIYRYEYNSRGYKTRETDPAGREATHEYAANEEDLLRVKQKNGVNYDLLEEMTYNSSHQSLTVKDAAGQTTTYTYNGQGQLLTVNTPARAGITENRTTTYSYNTNGYLQSVTGPATGSTTSYTYDSYGRTRTVTDSDGYVLTIDYDALDRQTKMTYPDSTFEETVYERLDAVRSRDRLGRWTHQVHDALQRVIATTDPLGRTVTRQWCGCGSMDALLDANGNRTEWERDIQGRVTKEIRANGSEWVYAFETTTSRLKTVTDPKDQVKTYSYLLDDNLEGIAYTNEQYDTPNVSFTYQTAFNRISTMVDGTGTTTYGYHPIGASAPLGAGMLATVDGPLSNDVIAYDYDELGRVRSRAINGIALSYEYDALGRVTTETNVLGAFSYQYDGVTNRLKTVTYPNGQTSSYVYYGNSGDHRLQEIHHKKSGGTTLSKFNYAYDAVGNIQTWTQQQDANPAKAYDFEYDRADQLRNAVWRTTDATPTILKRYSYTYDPAGNRTVEQIDNAPVLSAYDNMNRLSSQSPGGTMRFAGTLNEAATVTIQGAPAKVTSDNRFAGGAQVGSGTSQVVVKAKDYAGNERTSTYEVNVSGSSKAFTYDPNGNMAGDGTRTYEWDAMNRLLATKEGSVTLASFTYDGLGRRVRKTAGGVTTDYVYDGSRLVEERPSVGSTLRYLDGPFVDQHLGVLNVGTSTQSFFVTDHLGSVVQVTDGSQNVTLSREYDPFGKLIVGAAQSGYGYTGREWEPSLGLYYYRARYYDPGVGRFISEDPIQSVSNTNSYAYVENNPVAFNDPSGLLRVNITWEKVYRGLLGRSLVQPSKMTPNCDPDCKGKTKLEFVVDVKVILEIGSLCPGYAERHERMHASIKLGTLEKILAPLKRAEQKTYNSEPECYAAAAEAMKQVNQTPPEVWEAFPEHLFIDLHIPCLFQPGK